MTMRTITQSVTFQRTFFLVGVEGFQAPGVYAIEIDEEAIEGLSFVGYRRIAARITLAADPMRPGFVETVTMEPGEVDAVLAQSIRAS